MGSISTESHGIWAISRLGCMGLPIEDPDNGMWAISRLYLGQPIYDHLSAIYPEVGNHEPILATYM